MDLIVAPIIGDGAEQGWMEGGGAVVDVAVSFVRDGLLVWVLVVLAGALLGNPT